MQTYACNIDTSGLVSLSPVLVGPLPDRLDFLWVAGSNLLLMKAKSNGVSHVQSVSASAKYVEGMASSTRQGRHSHRGVVVNVSIGSPKKAILLLA
jgi:hypothetical protein